MHGIQHVETEVRHGDVDTSFEALLRTEVQQAFRNRQWSQLASWAVGAERLDGLIIDSQIRWALMWGALRAEAFDLAARYFLPLREVLSISNPLLLQAIDALIDRRLTGDLAEPLLRVPASPKDPRLGYDTVQRWRPSSCPQSAAAAEHALLGLAGKVPWSVFQRQVLRWAAELECGSPEALNALWVWAGRLATREIVIRSASESAPEIGEAAELLRAAVVALNAPPSLSAEVLTAFHVATSRTRHTVHSVERVNALAPVLHAACVYPTYRPLVTVLMTSMEFESNARPTAAALLESLLAYEASAPLLGKALLLQSTVGASALSLERAGHVQVVLERQGLAFSAWLSGVDDRQRAHFLGWLSRVAPRALVQALVIATLPHLSQRPKADVMGLVEEVLRARAIDQAPLWRAIGEIVLAERPALLSLALRQVEAGDEIQRLVDAALGPQPSARRFVAIWQMLRVNKFPGLACEVEKRLLADRCDDVKGLAEVVILMSELRAPAALKRKLADALLRGVKTLGEVPLDVRPAVVLARRWVLTRTLARPRKPQVAKRRMASKRQVRVQHV